MFPARPSPILPALSLPVRRPHPGSPSHPTGHGVRCTRCSPCLTFAPPPQRPRIHCCTGRSVVNPQSTLSQRASPRTTDCTPVWSVALFITTTAPRLLHNAPVHNACPDIIPLPPPPHADAPFRIYVLRDLQVDACWYCAIHALPHAVQILHSSTPCVRCFMIGTGPFALISLMVGSGVADVIASKE